MLGSNPLPREIYYFCQIIANCPGFFKLSEAYISMVLSFKNCPHHEATPRQKWPVLNMKTKAK